MGKSSGGGGGQTAGPEAERLAGVQADISKQLFGESSPVRQESIAQVLEALGGVPGQREQLLDPLSFDQIDPITTQDITANPAFAARKAFTEQQFAGAREQALGNTARGGTLQGVLGDLSGARAQNLTGQFGELATQEAARRERERAGGLTIEQINRGAIEGDINRTLAESARLGTGQTTQSIQAAGTALSALTGLGANQAAQANASANRDAAAKSATGQAVGQIGAQAVKKSSRDFKQNIRPVNDAAMLQKVVSVGVERFEYKPGQNIPGEFVGPIAEDTPQIFRTEDGRHVELYSLVGGLICAVRELTTKLERLEAEK